jgi:hypothetical protein
MDFKRFKQMMMTALKRSKQYTRSPEEREQHRKQRIANYRHRNAMYPYDSHRQRERYARNRMDEQQRNSHKPGTLQPRHIFGGRNNDGAQDVSVSV